MIFFLYKVKIKGDLMIIAIDGPAAAGKGTLAKKLALTLGYAHLDTGALYRAVAVLTMAGGGNLEDEESAASFAKKLTKDEMISMQNDPIIRTPEAGNGASKVSIHPKVRQALFDFQRNFGLDSGSAVLDGRDIGTVIFPDADLKFYVTASPEVRAKRRLLEFEEKGLSCDYDAILADVKSRDERDMNRASAPLKPADDAIIIDTSNMDEDEVMATALKYIGQ